MPSPASELTAPRVPGWAAGGRSCVAESLVSSSYTEQKKVALFFGRSAFVKLLADQRHKSAVEATGWARRR